jgi:hypothetical protein
MPETTVTITPTATTAQPTTAPTPAKEAPAKPTAQAESGELDDFDRADLERRFGIRRMNPTDETDDGSRPATKAEIAAGDRTEKPALGEAPKLKLKVDGEETEINVAETFPEFADAWDKLTDTQKKRIVAMHQKELASGKRFSEASLTRRQMLSLMNALKTDPMSVLGHPSLNHNVRKIVEDWLAEQIEYETLDPKEKELRDAKRILKEKEETERRSKEDNERKEIEALQGQYVQSYQKEIVEAIESSGLPKSTETVARIAYYLKEALKPREQEDGTKVPGVRLRAVDVVDLVREDYQRMMQRLVGQADAETLIKLFGDEFSEKIRKHLLKPIKTTGETPAKQATGERASGQPKKLTKDEWKRRIEERVG